MRVYAGETEFDRPYEYRLKREGELARLSNEQLTAIVVTNNIPVDQLPRGPRHSLFSAIIYWEIVNQRIAG